ncbi:hypothetical protein G6F46_012888 [Rhizopus delemar]|uniref:Uncharacterized protein n=1 Tax=Rhizopus delemar TaxID=936053 RepID=A0A9P6Y6Y7_9FUNG|nr:hypothetical protein G6F55_013394 [Rhizopus delemar]KAG1540963.1 hypothetical protein G6F50_014290 [Rhizopus delemar]KAG1576964.1 hypothetical protein G6F48_012954 [Rhizopus delemar]KAG1606608.1 hypothetical protein G6F46_012888 [Rhizopus delemar]
MPRFNSSASVYSNNGATPRRGGRVSGQVVSSYRSYVPPAGDRVLEAQIIVSPERAWDLHPKKSCRQWKTYVLLRWWS